MNYNKVPGARVGADDKYDKDSIEMKSSNAYKLVLGTVQFGLNYGIANSVGKPSDDEVNSILTVCSKFKVRYLDTAADYGDSENRIGTLAQKENSFDVITKFSKAPGITWKQSLLNSIANLKGQRINTILFHSHHDYIKKIGELDEIVETLQRYSIDNLGVSVYTNAEAESLLDDPRIGAVQLPFNLFDNRVLSGATIKALKNNGKKIFTRSVFLQGLFFMSPADLPEKLMPLAGALNEVGKLAREFGLDPGEMALRYCIMQPEIDGVLIGVDNSSQLKQNLNWLRNPLPHELTERIEAIGIENTELLNPANWNIR